MSVRKDLRSKLKCLTNSSHFFIKLILFGFLLFFGLIAYNRVVLKRVGWSTIPFGNGIKLVQYISLN
jgi:hypothetical protein